MNIDSLEALFVITSFLFQGVLILHFALRKWQFIFAMRYGWIVYVLSLPAAGVSICLLISKMSWYFWIGGFFYFAWAAYGFYVEYIRHIQWRVPLRWLVFAPYLILYLATVMFYWWPLGLIYKPLWYVFAVLFLAGTVLNFSSHKVDQVSAL